MKNNKNYIYKFVMIFFLAFIFVFGKNSIVRADELYSDNLIPKMSGYINGNITVSADAYYTPYGEEFKPWHAFDRNNNPWYCNADPLPAEGSHWLKVDFGSPKSISKITIACNNSHVSVKNFKLQGSNDNSNWKDIYTGINERYDDVKSEFTFNNDDLFRYYRILALDSYSSYGKTYCGIDELEMMEKLTSSISLNKTLGSINVGETDNLVATTTPAGAQVTWKSSDESIATVDSTGKVTALKEGQAVITATTADGLSATCAVTVTPKTAEPTNPDPDPSDLEKIVNIAHAKGGNTNNAGGDVTIIFHGAADTTLSVVKTADVNEVWVGDNFTYTIVVTNTGTKTAKAVVVNDPAPNHIDFVVNGITTTQGTVDPSSTSKNIIVNVGDIAPGSTVTIKIPATVVM